MAIRNSPSYSNNNPDLTRAFSGADDRNRTPLSAGNPASGSTAQPIHAHRWALATLRPARDHRFPLARARNGHEHPSLFDSDRCGRCRDSARHDIPRGGENPDLDGHPDGHKLIAAFAKLCEAAAGSSLGHVM